MGREEKTFLQSWHWGEFQKMMGNKIWRLGVYINDDLVGVSLVIEIAARRGKFLFLPHGPIVKIPKQKVLEALLKKLKEIAEQEKANFIRIAPDWQ